MVGDPVDYRWSSYQINRLGTESKLLSPQPLSLPLGMLKAERLANYRQFLQSEATQELLFDIRYALNKGLLPGTERFKSELEELTARRVRPSQRTSSRP